MCACQKFSFSFSFFGVPCEKRTDDDDFDDFDDFDKFDKGEKKAQKYKKRTKKRYLI